MNKIQYQQKIINIIKHHDNTSLINILREVKGKEVIDDEFKKSLLILAKEGIKIYLEEVMIIKTNLEKYDDKDCQDLILYLLQTQNRKIDIFTLESIFSDAVQKQEIEIIKLIFNKAEFQDWPRIFFNVETLGWLAKQILNFNLKPRIVIGLLRGLIEYNLFEIIDEVMKKYPNIDFLETLQNSFHPRMDMEEFFKRADKSFHFNLAKSFLNKILDSKQANPYSTYMGVRWHNSNHINQVEYLIKKFPQLTIYDIDEKYINYQTQPLDDAKDPLLKVGPNIMIMLLNNTPLELIEVELAQRIFNLALWSIKKGANSYSKTPNLTKEQEKIALLMLDKDFQIHDQHNILCFLCLYGMLDLLKKIYETRHPDLNEKKLIENNSNSQKINSPLTAAFEKNQNDIIKYLLDHAVIVEDELLLNIIDSKDIKDDLIIRMIKAVKNINYQDNQGNNLLHKAIINNKTIILLKQIIKEKINIHALNLNSMNALHLAAIEGNKEIFQLLITKGADPLLENNLGYNAYYYGLIHDNFEKLDIPANYFPFEIKAYCEILEYIKAQPEARYILPIRLKTIALRFAYLFDNKSALESYIKKHQNNHRPIHDLSIFNLPQEGDWNKKAWQQLAIEHGLKLAKYFFLAPIIDKNLGRAPLNLKEIETQAKMIKYRRASENPEMADIFRSNIISEYIFEQILDTYVKKIEDHIPDILIEGKDLEQLHFTNANNFDPSRCYMKKLPKDDLRGFILGNKTNCCQYVGAEGHNCAVHGMTSAYGGFYVIFKREKKGRCDNLRNWLQNLEASVLKEDFLKSFKEKSVKNKYQEIIDNLAKDFKIQYDRDANFNDIKELLKKILEEELEGEIIAQSWAWISKDGNLVLDSWERSCENYDILFKPFIKKLAVNILNENINIKKVLIGSSGCTPNNAGFYTIKTSEEPKDYEKYRDSNSQYLLAKNIQIKDSPDFSIKVNNAFKISNHRIQELESHFKVSKATKFSTNQETLVKIQKSWRQYCQKRQFKNQEIEHI
jgi:ankyrin repeat protein